MLGQSAGRLVAAAEVGVQSAAGSGDDRVHGAEEAGPLKPPERGEAVADLAMLVDVQDVGPGGAGGDGEVGVGLALPPGPDLVRVGGRVPEAVPRGGLLSAGLAWEDRPPAARLGHRPARRSLVVGRDRLSPWFGFK